MVSHSMTEGTRIQHHLGRFKNVTSFFDMPEHETWYAYIDDVRSSEPVARAEDERIVELGATLASRLDPETRYMGQTPRFLAKYIAGFLDVLHEETGWYRGASGSIYRPGSFVMPGARDVGSLDTCAWWVEPVLDIGDRVREIVGADR